MSSDIAATGLGKSFGGKIVLDGIDLEGWRGNDVLAAGANGAGKTTTVHQIMSTLVHADGGETAEARGHTSYGDITIRRSRLASGTGDEGQP